MKKSLYDSVKGKIETQPSKFWFLLVMPSDASKH